MIQTRSKLLVVLFLVFAVVLMIALPLSSAASQERTRQERTDLLAGSNEVYVPAGQFGRGCAYDFNNGKCDSDASPVTLTYVDAFYIDKTEVTNAQYKACVNTGVCQPPLKERSATREDYYTNPAYRHHPVIHVDWERANRYCQWAGKRLPTEAEWEKAARGTDLRWYPWGNEPPTCARTNFAYISSGDPYRLTPCVGDTVAVGSYPSNASPYGALDMVGNVREWVSDFYEKPYYPDAPYFNPQGPSDGGAKGEKLVRGGSWADQYLEGNNVWVRIDEANIYQTERIGFRCARSAGPGGTPTLTPIPTLTPTPLPEPDSQVVGTEGAYMWQAYDQHLTLLHIPTGTLSSDTIFTITYEMYPGAQGELQGIDHFFTISSDDPAPAPLHLLIGYRETFGVKEETIQLYYLGAGGWITTPYTLTGEYPGFLVAQIDQMGTYALLGDTIRTYLPTVLHSR